MGHRVLVTGTRGKSGMVRLLDAALRACGVRCWSRITGVVPTVYSPEGAFRLRRTASASVEEMRWWLATLPRNAEAVVLENSAVAPELQPLAGRWLRPTLTVWTNAHPDHQEVWGAGSEDALRVLFQGIPAGVPVVLGRELGALPELLRALERQGCAVSVAPGSEEDGVLERQRATALAACAVLGLDRGRCLEGMGALAPDPGDFRTLRRGDGVLASAFAANEPTSSEGLFASLRWRREDTVLWYHHRRDRSGRLEAFLPWFRRGWKEIWLTGALPWRPVAGARILGNPPPEEMERRLGEGLRIFGCGNVAGLPLALLTRWKGGFPA